LEAFAVQPTVSHKPPEDDWKDDEEGEDSFQQGNGDESQDFAEDGTGEEGYFDEHGNFVHGFEHSDASGNSWGSDEDFYDDAAEEIFEEENSTATHDDFGVDDAKDLGEAREDTDFSSSTDNADDASADETDKVQDGLVLAALTEQPGNSEFGSETTPESEVPPANDPNHPGIESSGGEEIQKPPHPKQRVNAKGEPIFGLEVSNQDPDIPPDADGEVYADRSDAKHADEGVIPGSESDAVTNDKDSDSSGSLPEDNAPSKPITPQTSDHSEELKKEESTGLPKAEKHDELEKPVDEMSDGDKLKAVLRKTLEKLPDKAREILQQLVSPENIVTTAGVVAATALAQGTPLAPFVDAGLTAYAVQQLGEQAKEAIEELNAFLQAWNNMQSEEDLEAAAEHLANLVEMGAGILLDKLMEGRGHGESEGGIGKKRKENEIHSDPEHPVLGEGQPTRESLLPGEGSPLDLKPTEKPLVEAERDSNPSHPQAEEVKQPTPETLEKPHPEESHPPSEAPPRTEEQLDLERKQKWRAEGETAWETLQEQVKNGQPYTGEFKTKAEFLKRYEEGQTFNSDTRSWGKQAELRADSREPITYSTESKPHEVLEGLIGTTEQGNDKSFGPYLKMLESLGLAGEGNSKVLAKLEELGFGKQENSEGGQSKKLKALKEDDVRSALKKEFEEKVLGRMTDPDAHSRTKLAAKLRESEPTLSKAEAMKKAAEQVSKQSEVEVEALLKKDPKLTREQAEVRRKQQASHRAALEITENLSSSDKGNLMEDWYDEVHGSKGDLRHLKMGEVDESRTPAKSGQKKGKLGDIKLDGVRVIDRLEIEEVNGKKIARLKEIKTIADELSGENLSQFKDFAKIASQKPEVDLPNMPGEAKNARKTPITSLTYALTNPTGVAKNAELILEAVTNNPDLSFEVFNKKGERIIVDQRNFDKWTSEDLIKWANSTD
jgi:hypothetical protein